MNLKGLSAAVCAGTVAVVLQAMPAQAALVEFFGENLAPGGGVSGDPVTARDAWTSGVIDILSTDLNSHAHKTQANVTPIDILFTGPSGSLSASVSGDVEIDGTPGAGRYGTQTGVDGDNFLENYKPESPGVGDFTITFDKAISAFGFFATDVGDFNNQLILLLSNGAATKEITIGNTAGGLEQDGSLLFYGFIDPHMKWTAIEFKNEPGAKDRFGFDDLMVGHVAPVPLPGALGLALLGIGAFGGLAAVRRRSA